ncbi:TetR/AcrR family transcriptional regulator [Deinococcus saxicola]|uniref:TetR/AcrR family transcriptional regulator n=1 Tax=Deinococcus saxicola TaxID=249406 RepID=UPI0039F0C41C
MTKRRGKADWLELGLKLLRDEGEQALTLERLCQDMGLTRGSFYHHFQNVAAYRTALLEQWLDTLTEAPIRQSQDAADALEELERLVSDLDHSLDLAFRAWARRSPEVAAAVEVVDARRVSYLTTLHRRTGHAQPVQLAELTYAVFVGAQTLGWVAGRPAFRALFQQVLAGLAVDPARAGV